MACNCCTPGGCKCKLSNAENAVVYSFTYNFTYKTLPWIHRRYPEPIFEATWREDLNRYVASNADAVLTNPSNPLDFYGDISNYSRRGMPAYISSFFGGYVVEDYDGNNSATYMGRTNAPIPNLTVFALEEKQDLVKRECQLWVKFKKWSYNSTMNVWEDGPWSELELLHFVKWDIPAGPETIVSIPGERFSGPDSVELRFFCVDPCSITPGTYVVSGQADWVTRSIIQFPIPLINCISYGSYDGTVSFIYKNCDNRYVSETVNNKATKILVMINPQCGYLYPFTMGFTGLYGNMCGDAPPSWCANDPDNLNCCGNILGGYRRNPDGTIFCGPLHQISPFCTYYDDPHNRHLIDEKTAVFNGYWNNAPTTYFSEYDCATQMSRSSPNEIYKAGTVTVTGV